jgi:predicted transcriptional regulator
MDQLWRLQEATGRAVLDAVNASSDRERAYTTVMTVLVRLEAKGFVRRTRVKRSDVFRPAIVRDDWLRERASVDVARLLDAYGDVALAQFARQVDGLEPGRREQLKRLAGLD